MPPGPPTRPSFVLVVDDEPSVRAFLCRVIESAGYRPLSAASGTEGFDLLSQHHADIALLLLDVTMDGLDGCAFRELQLATPHLAAVPTIIMSGRVVDHEVLRRLRPAAALVKPVRVPDLRAAI